VSGELTGRTAELMLNAALGHPMSTAMYEGLCAGNSQTLVTGAAICYAPTVELLRRAAVERRNLIISREHPFYLHGGLNYSYTTGGLEAALKDDPVVQAKREIVNTNKLMVYRFGVAWDHFRPHAQSEALARALGLNPEIRQPSDRSRGVVCNLPATTLNALAQVTADKLKARSSRTVGDPASKVTYNGFCVILGIESITFASMAPDTLVLSVWIVAACPTTSTAVSTPLTFSAASTRTVCAVDAALLEHHEPWRTHGHRLGTGREVWECELA